MYVVIIHLIVWYFDKKYYDNFKNTNKKNETGYPVVELVPTSSGTGSINLRIGPTGSRIGSKIFGLDPTKSGPVTQNWTGYLVLLRPRTPHRFLIKEWVLFYIYATGLIFLSTWNSWMYVRLSFPVFPNRTLHFNGDTLIKAWSPSSNFRSLLLRSA